MARKKSGLKSAAVDWSKVDAGVYHACFRPKGGAAWKATGLSVVVIGSDVKVTPADFPCMSSSRVAWASVGANPTANNLCGSKAGPCKTIEARAPSCTAML